MTTQAETDAYLDSLPRLSANSVLKFNCDPDVPCFNHCCGDLNLVLSPYDVLRLRLALGIDSKTFIRKHGAVSSLPGNQFPSLMLKMTETRARECPFVGEDGCSVYPHRPGACRAYPVGRGASIDETGKISEEYVLVQEPHCLGFDEPRELTVAAYLESQGMRQYIDFDNKYLRLMFHWSNRGRPLPRSLFGDVFLAVYRTDALQEIPGASTAAEHIDDEALTSPRRTAEVALANAMKWLEKSIVTPTESGNFL